MVKCDYFNMQYMGLKIKLVPKFKCAMWTCLEALSRVEAKGDFKDVQEL